MSEVWRSALTARGAQVEDGRLAGFGPADEPRSDAPLLTALLDQSIVQVSGDDAPAFLQGQLTNDFDQVIAGRAQLSAYCTPKGRVLATPLLYPFQSEYAMQLPAELAAPTRQRLQMYVLRSRVRLTDASDRFCLMGLIGPNALDLVRGELGLDLNGDYSVASNGGVTAVALPGERVQLVSQSETAIDLWDRLRPASKAVGQVAWDRRAIAAGIPEITDPTQDQFVPQMLNLELIGGVSFTKGCYPGQEIVARAQHLGQVKRRLARFSVEGREAQAGAAVYAGEHLAGMVVNAAATGADRWELLAVIQVAALTDGSEESTLRLDDPAGAALYPLPLPYALPAAPKPSAVA